MGLTPMTAKTMEMGCWRLKQLDIKISFHYFPARIQANATSNPGKAESSTVLWSQTFTLCTHQRFSL
jgi:hypothetical protein